jgi:hypothetical protein
MARSATISKIRWATARSMWEADAQISFVEIALMLGTTRQTVQTHATRVGWVRRLDMQTVSDRAHAAADSKLTESPAGGSSTEGLAVAGSGENRFPREMHPIPDGITVEEGQKLADSVAIDRRAEVLSTHRKEWKAVRTLAYTAIRSKNMEEAKHMKIIAESLKVVQDAERKAWGLDSDEKPKAVQVIINRKSGVAIGR